LDLGSLFGLYVWGALFPGLLLASLLSVVGHHHGRERGYQKDIDITHAEVGSKQESAPSSSPPESITDT
jgi:hypothetical protein